MQTTSFAGGMTNRVSRSSIPEGHVADAVNIDIDNAGVASRRSGITEVLTGHDVIWGKAGYVVAGSSLCAFDGSSVNEVCGGIYGTEYDLYSFNGTDYFSDGLVSKKITGGVCVPWGIDPPAHVPALSRTAGTKLPSGRYMACFTYYDASGVESGCSDFTLTETGSTGSLSVSGWNFPDDTQIVGVNVYMTPHNGETLYLVASIPRVSGLLATEITALPGGGKKLSTEDVTPIPPGRIITRHNARIYVADDSGIVWFTDEYAEDQCHIADNYYQFPEAVTVMLSVPEGLWIVADKTYFYSGSPGDSSERIVSNHGAAFGTGLYIPKSNHVAWFSDYGWVIGGAQGEHKNLQEDKMDIKPVTSSGAGLYREEDGIASLIMTRK